ncbi:MAG: hypothetical protein PHY16_03415 [Methylobacter sp.]|nr:hypothetical protein [Methylobacter sp.]
MNTNAISSLTSRKFSFILLIALITCCFLPGCGNNNQSNVPVQPATIKYDKATTLEGAVSDDHGPVKSGNIRVTDSKSQVVASTVIHDSGQYSVAIPAGTRLPIVLAFSQDVQNATAEKLITVVVYTNITKYDINPRTTAIAKKAQAMGGYTHRNLILAAESAASVPDANKTTAGFHGDPTKQYGGWH